MSPFRGRAPGARASRRISSIDWFVGIGFIAAFALYSIQFVYFFVDDEAIPFVYAQNVLQGDGLVYNPDDGPVEAYSDFLSIWIDVGILAAVNTLGVSRLWALVGAEVLAFACAIVLVAIAFRALRRRSGEEQIGMVAGMAFVALAGPLAVWSWSALETTLFALIIGVLVVTLLGADSKPLTDRVLLVSIVAAFLCRIDGFVWCTAMMLPVVAWAGSERRRELITRVLLPALAVFVLYHAWRIWYFGETLPMPIYAKVLYKLGRRETLVANDPPEPYVIAFLRTYRWLPLAPLLLGSVAGSFRSREIRSIAMGSGLIAAYLWIVGDWMFGFRFFVPLLLPIAILVAAAFSQLARYRRPVATVALVIWTAGLALVAFEFREKYRSETGRESWFATRSVDPVRLFQPYYDIYLQARSHVRPGDTIAYNQAGFVPFMLRAKNIDDLGICTKFYAKLPTTDIIFTEVGRYSPMTMRPVLRTSETYTLSRAPRLILAPGGDIRRANAGFAPATVLAGAYRLIFTTEVVAAYVPAGAAQPVRDLRQYRENLAHISHLRRARLNGREITASDYRPELQYLYGGRRRLSFEGEYSADFIFSDADEPVYELYIANARSAQPAVVTMTLLDSERRVVHRESLELASRISRSLHVCFDRDLSAAILSLSIRPKTLGLQALDLEDVRVQGQTPALKQYLMAFHD